MFSKLCSTFALGNQEQALGNDLHLRALFYKLFMNSGD